MVGVSAALIWWCEGGLDVAKAYRIDASLFNLSTSYSNDDLDER